MLCEQCKQREANIVIREVTNGVATERHLCSQCASGTEIGMLMDGDSPFAKLLSGILGLNMHAEEQEESEGADLICPTCHTAFRDFITHGRFGCADCYDTFGLLIQDNIKKLQGNDTHVGKKPRYLGEVYEHARLVEKEKEKISLQEEIELLKAKQEEAVREEDYEAAAHYRDEIKKRKERAEQ